MNDQIEKILILGGGTAGWMTASYLAKALGDTVSISVLEAPAIPKIGVGEATVPNLQTVFFDFLGLKERDWMPECNASFKTGIKFINWRTEGEGQAQPRMINGRSDHFYHVFGLLPEHDRLPLSHYWVHRLHHGETTEPFDYACCWEPTIMDALKAPCWPDGRPATTYAWHFDAHLIADFLRGFATERLGVTHHRDEMVEVEKDGRGFITALRTKRGDRHEADLFVDCSGFRGLLINQAMGEPFIDMNDYLFCDSAVASAVPHDDEEGVEPYTSAIAMKHGWTWKIPMLGRFGTGYVYSSRFAAADEATDEFCRMWKLDPETQPMNHIRFRVGRNRQAWVRNCVSIGLSSCFLEPLESSGIYFITAAIYQLAKHFPDKTFNQVLIDRFNREIEEMFDDTRDFIQAHFALSPRSDTAFWRASSELNLAPDFQEKIRMYKACLPINAPVVDVDTYYNNFEAEFRNFWTNGSYYCIFTGLDVIPDAPLPSMEHRPAATLETKRIFGEIKNKQQEMSRDLPPLVDYLRALHNK